MQYFDVLYFELHISYVLCFILLYILLLSFEAIVNFTISIL